MAIAVVSLALGIGVNTAVFSLIDQLLLWSVPARDAGQLVNVQGGFSDSYPFFLQYRDRNQVFSGVTASSNPQPSGVRPEGARAGEVGRVSYVSGTYFDTLGIGPAAGRVIAESDDVTRGGSPVAVLSYGYWQRRFAGDTGVIGRKFTVNGYPLEIAGIAAKGFDGLFQRQSADVFVPLTMYPVTTPTVAATWNTPRMSWLSLMARLKPGVSMTQAQASLRVLSPQVMEAINAETVRAGGKRRNFSKAAQITLTPGARGASRGRQEMADPLQMLLMATGLVLLIACANVANLLLARAAGRGKEIAVRLAVGATRGRLIRQLLTENLILAVTGGALALALAYWGVSALAATGLVAPGLQFQPNLRVAAFSVGVTLLTSLLFGLAPAFRATRVSLSGVMKEGGQARAGGSRLPLGKILIAGQVALSLTLLVGAGLFIRTLRNLDGVDTGFQRQSIMIVDVDPTNYGYQGHRLRLFYDELLERTRGLAGVRAAGLSVMTPLGMNSRATSFTAEGYQPKSGERMIALSNPVSAGYFATMGIPLLLGRDFEPRDEPSITPSESAMAGLGRGSGSGSDTVIRTSRVCVVNESLARHLYGQASPIGRHLSSDDKFSMEGALEIVGVAKDVRHMSLRKSDSYGIIYVPGWSEGAEARWLLIRVGGNPTPVMAAFRQQLIQMDSNVPVLSVRTLEEDLNGHLERERLIAYLSGLFGVLALALASIGLYGVMAYAVTQRTREVGIRMALGAHRGHVVGMILRESMVPVLAGAIVGLAASLMLTRLVAGLLFGVAPRDPLSIGLASAALLSVALLAAMIPARRASRVEPLIALRYE